MATTVIDRPGIRVVYLHRGPDDYLGRFGGGWQWSLGAQATDLTPRSGCVLIDLLVCSLRITWGRRDRRA